MIATRVLRIFFGAYSLISATTLGITPPMPRPAMKRQTTNSVMSRAKPLSTVKPLNRMTQIVIAFLRPILSDSGPKNMAPAIMPNSAALPMLPACSGLRPHSFISSCITTP